MRRREVGLGALARVALLALGALGCGDAPKPEPEVEKPKAPVASPVAAATAPPVATKETLLAEVRQRKISDEDFTEADSNRDPFHSFLSSFAVQTVVNRKQHKIILEKFALDELKLIAVVGGEGTPSRAMFVDPGGVGWTITRGDHVSKSDALVTRIAPDRVFLQIEEDDGGKIRTAERVVELHAGEAAPE